jgi:glycosyltransferase involved in cell wall biosynthesis
VKILFLTQYFPPEIGAPQNRLYELAIRLQKQGIDITVLTAMPNYPSMAIHKEYEGLKYHYEEMNGLKIHRSSIYVTKSKSITKRLRNYFSFVWSSYQVGKKKLESNYDIVFCESPPLFLGISAYYLSKKKKAKMIFNVSDLWPESAEKLGIVTNKLFLGMATKLEEFLYKKSILITGQTQGIVENISIRFPSKDVYWLPNGVDLSYYNPGIYEKSNWRIENRFSNDDKLFFYGGIIGHAQGLTVILKAAELLKSEQNIKFILMGSGPEKEDLQKMKSKLQLDNVFFFEPVTKLKMPHIVGAINASIIPLRKLDLFLGAIPSKVFENLSMEKPIILGVDGEARQLFIEEGNCGLFFEPENHKVLAKKIMELASNPELEIQLGKNGRKYVDLKFNRNNIANDFASKLNNLELN